MSLLEFFQQGNFADARLDTAFAIRASPTLANVQSPSEEDVVRYLSYWQNVSFL
jgi:hypothetical protein